MLERVCFGKNKLLKSVVFGDIAHLVERFHGMEEAWGSNPHISTQKTSEQLMKQINSTL